ncbi:17270_t:CDS:2, partial [Racocetra persica]
NNLKAPSEYIKNLKKIRTRKGINDIFSSNKDPKDLQGMFSQLIDFNEVSTVSLDPLPNHLQNIEDCHNYLRIWNQHYDRLLQTKTRNETKSNSLMDRWKGRDIK